MLRGYRIIKVVHEEIPSFSFDGSSLQNLVDQYDKSVNNGYTVLIEIGDMPKVIEAAEGDFKKQLQHDLAVANAVGDTVIEYTLF
jgi:hypothetical protein